MTNLDTAHLILNKRIDVLEETLGWETNRETLKEGRNIFVFECMFSTDNNVVTVKKFEVSVGNAFLKEIK